MKKYLVFLLLPFLAACTKSPKEAVISGTLLNYNDTVAYLSLKGLTETIKINADKTFEVKKLIDKPVLYNLRVGRKRAFELYANPGDTTKIEVDFENIKAIPNYEGKVNEPNYIILERGSIISKHISDYRSIFSLPIKEFYTKLDSLQKELLEKVNEISIKDIAKLEAIRIDYYIKGLKAEYPEFNAYYNEVDLNRDSIDYSFFEGFDANNANHLMYNEYCGLVNKYITSKLLKIVNPKTIDSIPVNERISKFFSVMDENVTNSEVRDYLKQSAFMEDLTYGEFWKLSDLVNTYLAECQTVGYKNIIEKLYSQKMLLAPGKPAPAFKYKDINGKEYSLDGLKGNLVYIDFWATWCGPCKHELPYLEEVENAYKGKKIIFISMSVDDDMFAWDKMVKDKKMLGLQLHADGAWASSVVKDYQIKGIPTFVLIDEKGAIINPSAPRPSSGADLVNLLDENLAKIK